MSPRSFFCSRCLPRTSEGDFIDRHPRHLGFLRCQVARPFWVVPDAPPVLHRRQRDTRLICVIARERFGLLVTLNEGGLLPLVQIFSTAHFSKVRAVCLSTELPNNSTKRVFWIFVLLMFFMLTNASHFCPNCNLKLTNDSQFCPKSQNNTLCEIENVHNVPSVM